MADRAAFSIEFNDINDLRDSLATAGKRSEKPLQDMLVEVGEQMAARMRELVPVRTGRLKADIRVLKAATNKVIVGPLTVPYAAHVEFGTGRRGELTNGAYLISNGRVIKLPEKATAGINGQRAQPYVRPAAAEFIKSLGPKAANVGVEVVVGKGRLNGSF